MSYAARIKNLGFDSVQDYQEWHGLTPDGEIGPVTKRSLDEIRICGHPDKMAMSNVRPWRKRNLRWSYVGNLGSIDRDSFMGAAEEAFGYWSAVCGLTFEFGNNPDIELDTGKIDGPFSVLAYSGLPNGSDSRIGQKYDSDEPWIIASNPPRHKIDLVAVICHEVGHALGLVHIPQSSELALMNPTYRAGLRTPQRQDIEKIQAFYGPSKAEPKPPDDDDEGDLCVVLRVPSGRVFPWSDIAGLTTGR